MAKRMSDAFGVQPYQEWEDGSGPFTSSLPSAVSGERANVEIGPLGAGMFVEGLSIPESQIPINTSTASVVRTEGDTNGLPIQFSPFDQDEDSIDLLSQVDRMPRLGGDLVEEPDVAPSPPVQQTTQAPMTVVVAAPPGDGVAARDEPPAPPTPPTEIGPEPQMVEGAARPPERPMAPLPPTDRAEVERTDVGAAPAVIGDVRRDVVPTEPIPGPPGPPGESVTTVVRDVVREPIEPPVERVPDEGPPMVPATPPAERAPVVPDDGGIVARTDAATAPPPAAEPIVPRERVVGVPAAETTTPGRVPEPPPPTVDATDREIESTDVRPTVVQTMPTEVPPPPRADVRDVEAPPPPPPPTEIPERPRATSPGIEGERDEFVAPPRMLPTPRPDAGATPQTVQPTAPIPVPAPEWEGGVDVAAAPTVPRSERRTEVPEQIVPPETDVRVPTVGGVDARPRFEQPAADITREDEASDRREMGPRDMRTEPGPPPPDAEPTMAPRPPEATPPPMLAAVTEEMSDSATERQPVPGRADPFREPTADRGDGGQGSTSTWGPEPPPPGAAAPGAAAPPATTGYEPPEDGGRGRTGLYGAMADTDVEQDDRWRRERAQSPLRSPEPAANVVVGGGSATTAPAGAPPAARSTFATAPTGGPRPADNAGQTGGQDAQVVGGNAVAPFSTEVVAGSDVGPRDSGPTADGGRTRDDVAASQSDIPFRAARPSAEPTPQPNQTIQGDVRPNAVEGASTSGIESRGRSGVLLSGEIAKQVQSVLSSSSTNPNIQRTFEEMMDARQDAMRAQMREQASEVAEQEIGDTFRKFLRGA